MPGNRKNFAYQTYVDDDGDTWNVRGESGGVGGAVDGHAAFTAGAPVWGRQTKRRHTRFVEATDAATNRKVRFIVYTAAAFAAIAGGDDITVTAPGSATAITYDVTAKIPERKPIAGAGWHLAD